jgi:NIMA (never in mitosis gene a)-related kinase 1/4/5
MSLRNFEIISKLGQGTYSTVFKVRRFSDRKIYALKQVKIDSLCEKEKKNALNEIRILASLKHPNIIAYKEAFFEENNKSLCLVMEFADGGDLRQKIKRCIKNSVRLEESFILSLFIQTVNGLKALHNLGVIHRDIKSANVLLNKDGTVKLGDMNVSKRGKKGFLKTPTGTPFYASPEMWQEVKYDTKSDIWSLGCVLYEALALRLPFRAKNIDGLRTKVLEGGYESIPAIYSSEISHVLGLLLRQDPGQRPSCEEILRFELVRKLGNQEKSVNLKQKLMKTIEFPEDLSLFENVLPKVNYENEVNEWEKWLGEGEMYRSAIFPRLRSGFQEKLPRLAAHRLIECSSDRIKRIKEVYLSPGKLFMSPQARRAIISAQKEF